MTRRFSNRGDAAFFFKGRAELAASGRVRFSTGPKSSNSPPDDATQESRPMGSARATAASPAPAAFGENAGRMRHESDTKAFIALAGQHVSVNKKQLSPRVPLLNVLNLGLQIKDQPSGLREQLHNRCHLSLRAVGASSLRSRNKLYRSSDSVMR